MADWPKRPDGTNKTMGEMTPEERKAQVQASLGRLKAELENPKIAEVIERPVQP
jgi:hypothetical protein